MQHKEVFWLKGQVNCAFYFKNKTGPGLGHIYPTVANQQQQNNILITYIFLSVLVVPTQSKNLIAAILDFRVQSFTIKKSKKWVLRGLQSSFWNVPKKSSVWYFNKAKGSFINYLKQARGRRLELMLCQSIWGIT